MPDLKKFIQNGDYYYIVEPPRASVIVLNASSIEFATAGETYQLTATVIPDDALDKNVVWSSSDTSIATVSQTGLVTCVTPGECNIVVTSVDTKVRAVCAVAIPQWKPGANTVAYRPLTSTTTVNDQSGNNYTLTQTGGSFTTLGNVSCFYNGGSTSGYFNLTSAPKIPSGNADRTVSLWVRVTALGSYVNYIFNYGNRNNANQAFSLYAATATEFAASTKGNEVTSSVFTKNVWYLLTFTLGSGAAKFYVNGEYIGSLTGTQNTQAISSSYPLRMFRLMSSTSTNYQTRGYLSEVIIEDKAWTATEIANYFNNNKEKYGL